MAGDAELLLSQFNERLDSLKEHPHDSPEQYYTEIGKLLLHNQKNLLDSHDIKTRISELRRDHLQSPRDTNILMNISDTLFYLEDFKAIADVNNKILALDMTNIDALCNMGFAFHGLREYDQALKYFFRSISKNPLHLLSHTGMATTYMQKGDDEMSKTEKKIVRAIMPSMTYFWTAIYLNQIDWKECREIFSKAEDRFRTGAVNHFPDIENMIKEYYMGSRESQEIIELFQSLPDKILTDEEEEKRKQRIIVLKGDIQRNPLIYQQWFELAGLHDSDEKRLKIYHDMKVFFPDIGSVFENIAEIYRSNGDIDKAVQYFNKVIDAGVEKGLDSRVSAIVSLLEIFKQRWKDSGDKKDFIDTLEKRLDIGFDLSADKEVLSALTLAKEKIERNKRRISLASEVLTGESYDHKIRYPIDDIVDVVDCSIDPLKEMFFLGIHTRLFGYEEETRKIMGQFIEHILQKTDLEFQEMPGTRNEFLVLPFSHEYSHHLFFKRSHHMALMKEYYKSVFFFNLFSRKDKFSPPLVFIDWFKGVDKDDQIDVLNKYNAQYYYVMWRLAGKTLARVAQETGLSKEVMDAVINDLVEFHIGATLYKDTAVKELGLKVFPFAANYNNKVVDTFGFEDHGILNVHFKPIADYLKKRSHCVTHGDHHPGNKFYLENEKLSTIDLEKMCIAPAPTDLVYFAEHPSSGKWDERFDFAKNYHENMIQDKAKELRKMQTSYEIFLKDFLFVSLFFNSRIGAIAHRNFKSGFRDKEQYYRNFETHMKQAIESIKISYCLRSMTTKEEREGLKGMEKHYNDIIRKAQ
ncbi:phosphotransferase [Thermoproteota archaeon]